MTSRKAAKVAAASFLAGVLLSVPLGAGAHDPAVWYPKEWPADRTYSIGYLHSHIRLSGGVTQIHSGPDGWNAAAGNWFDMTHGTDDSTVTWAGNGCDTAPTNAIWVISRSLPDGTLGTESTCVSSTAIVRSVISFDDDFSTTWYFGSSTSVPSGEHDFLSVSVHEFGHASGFAGHWSSTDSSTNCSTTSRHTMCSGLPTGTSYKRSLEFHDIHVIEAAY